ncbi:hypothetical protein QVM48_25075 [Pseudomonas soli]|jgi:hypothetical protein|uniref:hypothetical protein n=1 Tax=Pseudomonas soli TaxID=1306993 RepID=UPI002894227C|nr:hypothetical protein [Pseudomonas soli]MDT3712852.1 hypothetical protein [Pseudomonas soli]MDT3730188.1 hypothetical protein [Pseudomonas soli]
MATKTQWLAVLKAIAMSKATWRLIGTLAVLYGYTHGELIAGLVGEVIADVSGAL